MNAFAGLDDAKAGNTDRTPYLNYIENGRDDPRNTYHDVIIETVRWADLNRRWFVDVKIVGSSDPSVIPGSLRCFMFEMGTEVWKINAFHTNVKNFILAGSGFDPDVAADVATMKVGSQEAQFVFSDAQPLRGSRLWVQTFRSRRKVTPELKAKIDNGTALQDEVWSKMTRYSFKPAKFEDWRAHLPSESGS